MSCVALCAVWCTGIDVSAAVWNLNLSGRSGRWTLSTSTCFSKSFHTRTCPVSMNLKHHLLPTLADLSMKSALCRSITLLWQPTPFLSPGLGSCTLLDIATASRHVLHIQTCDESPKNTKHVSLLCSYCIVTTRVRTSGIAHFIAESTSDFDTCFLIPALTPSQEPNIIVFSRKVSLGTHARQGKGSLSSKLLPELLDVVATHPYVKAILLNTVS